MVRIVLTHGRGLRGRDEDKLREKFTWYMRQGLEDTGYDRLGDQQVAFIYYGDVLERAEEASGLAVAGGEGQRFAFGEDAAQLGGQLARAAGGDARVCTLVEEQAARQPIAAADAGEDARHDAAESALERRTEQLLEDPRELQAVLHDRFGSTAPDDDTVRQRMRDLRERVGDDPRQVATRRAVDTTGMEEPGVIDTVLREWIVAPVTDAVAAVKAMGRVLLEHGLDVRQGIASWQQAVISDILTRFEGTDFGREWTTAFDVIALLTSHTMLDGFYIMRWMQDVNAYFDDATIRNDVRELFRKVLRNSDEPTVLIAHSLGSVIAYDTLREYPELDVSGLVTLGSPLSIDYFRERLARPGESKNALPVPATLDEWVNVYAEMDPLALGSGIEQFFEGGGDDAGRGPVDREVENTGYLDAHSPDQYLRSRVTARAIQQMIGGATVREGLDSRNAEGT